MKKFIKGSDNGYRITDSGEGWGYYITIGNGKEYRHYEFSGTYNTLEQTEQYLQENDYSKVVRDFNDWGVYLECIEQV